MKNSYKLFIFILFIFCSVNVHAVCPVSISAGGPLVFCDGDSVVLTATSGPGYTYQWSVNFNMIPGATGQTYVAKTAGNYFVYVSVASPFCSSNSNTLTVTVELPLTVSITDLGGSLCGASTDILELSPQGTGFIYQWFEDTIALPNANSYQLEIGHDGLYDASVTNSCGIFYYGGIQVTYFSSQSIPQLGVISASGSTTLCIGGSVQLTDQFCCMGYGHQWYQDGVAIPGANNYYYNATQSGVYNVILSYQCFTNNYFYSNSIIVTQTGDVFPAGSITAGGPLTFCSPGSVTLNAATNPSWSYEWYKNNVAIGAPNVSSYVASSSGSYTCRVSNGCGASSSNAIVVDVTPTSAFISVNGSTTICTGTTTVLTSNSAGTGGTYQWQLNGVNIGGATSSTYAASLGNYTCVITNSCGTFTSNAISISQAPCNTGLTFDGSNDYVKIPNNASYAFGNGNFSVEAWINMDVNQTASGPIVLSNRTSTGFLIQLVNGRVRLVLAFNQYQFTGADLRDNICHHIAITRTSTTAYNLFVDGNFVETASIPNQSLTTTNMFVIGNNVFFSSTQTYKGKIMELRLWNLARSQSELQTAMNTSLTGSEPGLVGYWKLDDGAGQIVNDYSTINNDGQLGSLATADSNDPLFTPTCPLTGCTLPTSSITAGGPLTFCSPGSVTLNANTGAGLSYQWKLNGTNIGGATASSYSANATGVYSCAVTNTCGTLVSNTLSVTANTTPTATITPSGSTTICTGNSVFLNANTGTGLSYQWQLNTVNIGGATSSVYSASAAGSYACIVTNTCGSTTSNSISVTLVTSPTASITAGGSTTFCTGGSVLLSANTGTGLSYQWKLNTFNIAGATSLSYSATTAGSYTCVVSNSCGSVTSNAIAVTVNTTPAASITAGGSTTFCTGGSVTLNANTGTGLSYQWKLNGGNIPGATNSSYSANATGSYTCMVTNSCGSATSNAIAVTVNTTPTATITAGGGTTFCTGGSVLLNANTGTGLSYQWKLNGSNIPGATASSYAANTAGNYTCLVTNSCGSVTSNTITTTVVSLPAASITAAGSTSFCSGGSVTLNANTGTGLSYQWKLNGGNIPGATLPSYSASAAGNYTCVVTNSCGSVTSNTLAVVVTPLPTAPTAVSGQSHGICLTTTNYTISAVVGASVYNWIAPAGAVINSGQGTTSVNITYPSLFSSGTVSVNAANSCGTSASTTLTVSSALITPASIQGVTSVCEMTRYIYSVPAVEGATDYQWSVPSKARVMQGQGTNTVEIRIHKFGGSIAVIASNACTSATAVVLPISITTLNCSHGHQVRHALDALIYPNPSQSYFSLQVFSETGDACVLVIRDVAGRELERRENISPGETVTFGSGLANGIYLAEIIQGDEHQMVRVVKND